VGRVSVLALLARDLALVLAGMVDGKWAMQGNCGDWWVGERTVVKGHTKKRRWREIPVGNVVRTQGPVFPKGKTPKIDLSTF
jgi:hypothetical protein